MFEPLLDIKSHYFKYFPSLLWRLDLIHLHWLVSFSYLIHLFIPLGKLSKELAVQESDNLEGHQEFRSYRLNIKTFVINNLFSDVEEFEILCL